MTEVKPNVFARFGNDLHSGKRSYPFIGKRKLWLMIAAARLKNCVLLRKAQNPSRSILEINSVSAGRMWTAMVATPETTY